MTPKSGTVQISGVEYGPDGISFTITSPAGASVQVGDGRYKITGGIGYRVQTKAGDLAVTAGQTAAFDLRGGAAMTVNVTRSR